MKSKPQGPLAAGLQLHLGVAGPEHVIGRRLIQADLDGDAAHHRVGAGIRGGLVQVPAGKSAERQQNEAREDCEKEPPHGSAPARSTCASGRESVVA